MNRPDPLPRRGAPRHPDHPLHTVGLRVSSRVLVAADDLAIRYRVTRSEALRVALDAGFGIRPALTRDGDDDGRP